MRPTPTSSSRCCARSRWNTGSGCCSATSRRAAPTEAEDLVKELTIWSRQAEGTFSLEQEARLKIAYADLAFRKGALPTARAWYRKVADAAEYEGTRDAPRRRARLGDGRPGVEEFRRRHDRARQADAAEEPGVPDAGPLRAGRGADGPGELRGGARRNRGRAAAGAEAPRRADPARQDPVRDAQAGRGQRDRARPLAGRHA